MRTFLVFVLLFWLTDYSYGQRPFIKEFWIAEQGTPVRVNDLIYSSQGYLWLATENGVYRFNGRSFLAISDSQKHAATAISEIDGRIYAGYNNGTIAVISYNRPVLLKIINKQPSSAITSISGKRDLLYITTEEEGLFVIANQAGLQLNAASGLADNFIYNAVLQNDEIILASDRGVNRVSIYQGKPLIDVLTTAKGLPDNLVRVIRQVPSSLSYWIGTQAGGLAMYDDKNEAVRSLKLPHTWAWGQVNDILPENETKAWIATEDGYLLYVTRYGDSLDVESNAYEGTKFTKLVQDKTGNIWCATNKGLLMSTAVYLRNLQLPIHYHFKDITSIMCNDNNELLFTQNNALYRQPIRSNAVPEFVLRTQAAISCLQIDANDNLWIGTFGKGLYRYTKERLHKIEGVTSLAEGHILSIAITGQHLWVASLNGVEEILIEDNANGLSFKLLKHHNKTSGIGSDYVYQLYPDSKGRMWMATDGGGICMYDGKYYTNWNDSDFTSDVVYAITEDANGHIWAGTLEKGLFRLDGNKWTRFTRQDGLQDMNIYALSGTANGAVIVVNESGVDEWYPGSRQFRHFNRRLGVHIDSTLAVPNCITRDRKGNVYVPFQQGFLMFKSLPNQYEIAPEIKIDQLSLFNKPIPGVKHVFQHHENHISFRFDGLNFTNPERLHFRYKLDNYDTNWVYTNDDLASFVQLPAGKYTFHVQASLSRSFSAAPEAVYSFYIAKPFWKRTWFIILTMITLLTLVYGYIKARERSLKNMSRLQKERMIFEYEHLKSQVNPHFLFNSLNTLVSLIEEDRSAAADYTVHLSDLYRNMLSYKDQELILLSEEYEIIKNYMFIQKSRFGNALQLNVDIPDHILTSKKIVPLALQLLVENAIKHNIVSISRPLTISITADDATLTVKNPVQPKTSKEKGAGLGIMNIRKRYGLLTSRETEFGFRGNDYVVILPLL